MNLLNVLSVEDGGGESLTAQGCWLGFCHPFLFADSADPSEIVEGQDEYRDVT